MIWLRACVKTLNLAGGSKKPDQLAAALCLISYQGFGLGLQRASFNTARSRRHSGGKHCCNSHTKEASDLSVSRISLSRLIQLFHASPDWPVDGSLNCLIALLQAM